jgi:hypothetical protein
MRRDVLSMATQEEMDRINKIQLVEIPNAKNDDELMDLHEELTGIEEMLGYRLLDEVGIAY